MNQGKEAIEAMAMGFVMLMLSVVLVFVARNVGWGKAILSEAVNTVDNSTQEAFTSSFGQLVHATAEMPISGVYALIGYNPDAVCDITCYVCDPAGHTYTDLESSCLKKHITGNVTVWATYEASSSQYHVFISGELADLTSSSVLMSIADARELLERNQTLISTVSCTQCINTTSVKDCCLMHNMHLADKRIRISAIYEPAVGKYAIILEE